MRSMDKNYLCGLLLCSTLFFAFNVDGYSQTHELGIRLSSFENFDFIYKKERRENQFMRVRLGSAGLGVSLENDNESVVGQLRLAIGVENRRALNDRLYFIHGLEPALSVNVASNSSRTNWVIQPGLGYVLGFQYELNKAFSVNVETIPSVNVGMNLRNGTRNTYTVNAGFNSNAVALTLAYRFKGKIKK